jgi:hypothetical protein
VAKLVACPPMVPKFRGLNHDADLFFIGALFTQINVRRKVLNFTYVSYGFVTSTHFMMIQPVEVCSQFESSNRL